MSSYGGEPGPGRTTGRNCASNWRNWPLTFVKLCNQPIDGIPTDNRVVPAKEEAASAVGVSKSG